MKRRLRAKGETFFYYGRWNLGLPRSCFSTLVNKKIANITQPRAPRRYATSPAVGSRSNTRLLAGPKAATPQIETNGRYLQDFNGPKRYAPTLSMNRPSPCDSARYEMMKGIKAAAPIAIAEETNGFNSTIWEFVERTMSVR